ncbi:hypothetical protein TWF481_008486 [Arthrobotrys musiformis]|uniref:Uncharacterized protein n=1 Tax=Arthrobotrys musiformis TaxID=47236 RepID=A0AAV9W9C0_9PEZI
MCTRTPSACHYLRPNPRGLPPGYLIALEQRLADTEAALSLSISLILELAPVHSITIRQPSPTSLETLNDEVLDLKKRRALDYLELSSLNYKKIKSGRTPDTSAEKREQQDEWQRWPIGSMEEVFSWWSRPPQPPSPRPSKSRRVMEDPREQARTPSLSPIATFEDAPDDTMSNSPVEPSFGADTGFQESGLSSDQVFDGPSRGATNAHMLHATQVNVPLEPRALFPANQSSGPQSTDFAGTYAAKLYSRPSTSASSIVAHPPIVPSQPNDLYAASSMPASEITTVDDGQFYYGSLQTNSDTPTNKTVSENVQRILDQNNGWF